MSSIPKVAFIGITSAGKSSAVNAVIGRRECYTGATRTTTAPATFEAIDDAGITFQLVDLPGLADIEDKVGDFDKTAMDTIRTCDIVYWLTDANRAFITQHEMDEFTKIRDFINKIGLDEGIAVQLAILVTKMDREIGATKPIQKAEPAPPKKGKPPRGEISDDEAESSIVDLYWGVVERFPDVRVAPFNAFGRSYHHAGSSDNLRKHVSKSHLPSKHNIGFSIKHFVGAIDEFRDSIKLKHCFEKVLDIDPIKYYCFHSNFTYSCGHYYYTTGCTKCGKLEELRFSGSVLRTVHKVGTNNTKHSWTPKRVSNNAVFDPTYTFKFANGNEYSPMTYSSCSYHGEMPSQCMRKRINVKCNFTESSKKLTKEFTILKFNSTKRDMLKTLIQHNSLFMNEITLAMDIPKQELIDHITQIKLYCRDDNEKFRALMICKNVDIHHRIEIYSTMTKYKETQSSDVVPGGAYIFKVKDMLAKLSIENTLKFDGGKEF